MAESSTETTTAPMSSSTSQLTENAVHDVVKQQIAVGKTILLQAVDLVDNHLTSDEQLTVHSKHLPGSTIGKHLRHARDHFVLLIECMQTPSPRVLSYDTRIRNTPMETSLEGARTAILDAVKQLEEVVPTANFDEEISLHAITPYMHSFKTSIGREVRVIAGELGIQLAEDFGFAPSTLVYQGELNLIYNDENKTDADWPDRETLLSKNKL
ncbi:hypothetical protein CVT25_014935 [Psilocybe cyanescens]|uniref:Uncharacterized protein n=1 Tax=Psilocybe cyanescens TaxID=93625 RepID=A0A409XI34_PSICY|nr:hypothetical protein CVT25_014935 [Psilocybe cyanescens]